MLSVCPLIQNGRSRTPCADNPTTLPSRQTWSGNLRRACSSMTSSTASLNAISARFSIGSRRILRGTFLQGFLSYPKVFTPLRWASRGLIRQNRTNLETNSGPIYENSQISFRILDRRL